MLFITNIIVPGILNFFAFYYITKKVVFKTSDIPPILLSLVFTVVSMPFGPIMMYISPLIIAFLGMGSWATRIIFLNIVYVVRFFILPLATSPEKIAVRQLFFYFLPAILGFMTVIKTGNPISTWILRIIYLVLVYWLWNQVIPMLYV